MQGNRRPAQVVTYFAQAVHGGPVKIGRSNTATIYSRLATLQTGSPYQLRFTNVLTGDLEDQYHKRFAHLRLTGEWFSPAPELAEIAQAVPDVEPEAALEDHYCKGFIDGWHAASAKAHAYCIDVEEEHLDLLRRLHASVAVDSEYEARVALKTHPSRKCLRSDFASTTTLRALEVDEAA